jgi:hypothetical protein
MIRLLRYLILGHVHEWEKPDEHGHMTTRNGVVLMSYKICRCAKCGVWRRFDL